MGKGAVMELSEKARKLRNARAREYYAQNREKQAEYNRRYWERQAAKENREIIKSSPDEQQDIMCGWLKRHQAKPKTTGCFYSYAVVCGETGLNAAEIIEAVDKTRVIQLEHFIAVQTSVRSNGERGIRVISLR